MKFTAEQIAGILEGDIVGNPSVEVFKLAKIEEGTKGSLTFLANPKYTNFIYDTKASATIVNKDFVPEYDLTTTLIKVEDAYKAFSKLLEYYNQVKMNKFGVEQPSFVSGILFQYMTCGKHVLSKTFQPLCLNICRCELITLCGYKHIICYLTNYITYHQ